MIELILVFQFLRAVFGGWNESKYGHGDITGQSGVQFWTNLKKVTARWPESEEAWKKYF